MRRASFIVVQLERSYMQLHKRPYSIMTHFLEFCCRQQRVVKSSSISMHL